MYDDLDMMKILEKKQEMYNYHPKGEMQQFMEDNYRKLQFRVEAIRSTEENGYGFYPGNQYKIHSILYGHIWKSLILEGAGGILHGGGSKKSDDVSLCHLLSDDRTAVSAAKQLFYVYLHMHSFHGIIHFCLCEDRNSSGCHKSVVESGSIVHNQWWLVYGKQSGIILCGK